MNNFELNIISHHKDFNNKMLKKYYVEGIDTIGAFGNEPFSVVFKNNTNQKVQVIISIDGTNILTGKQADTLVSKDMWVVNGYDTISLKAWPEDNGGGAAFIFTNANSGVAVHTHGDLSSRGIIAVAVFTEGHVEPIKITPIRVVEEHHHYHDHYPYTPPTYPYSPFWIYNGSQQWGNCDSRSNALTSNTISSCNNSLGFVGTSDCFYASEVCDAEPAVASVGGLEKLVSVGAGEHVDQKITYVSGLIKPLFTETIRVKYLWWDELQEKLHIQTKAQPQPSGFPGDHNKKNIDLKSTPRIGQKGSVRRVEQVQVFDRF